jgi:hypothetical protein
MSSFASSLILLLPLAASVAGVASVASVAGCRQLATGGADRSSLVSRSLVEACPLGVPDTHIRVVDTKDGMDLFFSTPQRNVDELRARVHDQARVNGPGRHRGAGHFGEHEGARDHGLRLWSMGEDIVVASVEDTSEGARLGLVVADSSRRADVRDRVVRRVSHLESRACD